MMLVSVSCSGVLLKWLYCSNVIHMLCYGGHGRCLYLNFCVMDDHSSVLLGSKVPRNKEHNFMAGVVISWHSHGLFFCTLSCKCLLPIHSQCLCLICLYRVSLSSETLPNVSFIGILSL